MVKEKMSKMSEEKLFRHLMCAVTEAEGAKLVAKNKRLMADGACRVPPDLDRKYLMVIINAYKNIG